MEREKGVTAPQRFVLRLLGRFPSVTASQLASALDVHPSTITGILKRLERRKLVTRRRDPHDRRRTFLALTARGRALDVEPSGTVEGAVEEVLSAQPEHKVAIAREVLTALAAELANRGQAPRAEP
ncbi:MAG: MarR family transcriptional regulator [Archangiaceae bacterium]|nr:MarR family transcriptional regulator [Archangiaceae bacterium]